MSGGYLWFGITDSLRWSRIGLQANASDTLTLATSVREVSPDEVESERRRRLEEASPTRGMRQTQIGGVSAADIFLEIERDFAARLPSSSTVPAYDQVVPGADASVWLRGFPMPGAEEALWILITEGKQVEGQVRLVRSDTVLAASRDWLLVLRHDALDAPVVHVLHRAVR